MDSIREFFDMFTRPEPSFDVARQIALTTHVIRRRYEESEDLEMDELYDIRGLESERRYLRNVLEYMQQQQPRATGIIDRLENIIRFLGIMRDRYYEVMEPDDERPPAQVRPPPRLRYENLGGGGTADYRENREPYRDLDDEGRVMFDPDE